ncbi:MAG TPA: ElyC/SanA/YdcF family protein [Candidatus Sulfomarinibacteraceae bacterium]|nr:ElyC/SanA/YdcF family protein [Candidatus Sulfomarinibacteraceae bacterium]
MRRRWKGCLFLLLTAAGLVASPYVLRTWVERSYGQRIYEPQEVEPQQAAIVFGAAVYRGGRLSPVLRDRMDTAIALYHEGKVQRLLLSGDGQSLDYNEPDSMVAYAEARGVPAGAIQPDYGGRRTYDTCYRARHIFHLERVVLVTQEFHLSRALFTCDQLGLEAVGVVADRRQYRERSMAWWRNRELAALLRAVVDVAVEKPPPVMGEPIPLG